jgi:hypothetical protein
MNSNYSPFSKGHEKLNENLIYGYQDLPDLGSYDEFRSKQSIYVPEPIRMVTVSRRSLVQAWRPHPAASNGHVHGKLQEKQIRT